MTDEVVTHAEVLRWLPSHVRRDLELAMPPEQRGWFTEAEAERYTGDLVEITRLDSAEPRYIQGRKRGVLLPVPFLPTITDIIAPTTAEINAGVER